MAASPTLTLKVEFEGEVRRLRGWPQDGSEPSLPALRGAVCTLFGFDGSGEEPFAIKYRDDEGDLCTLLEASLPDALLLAAAPPHTLRLVITRACAEQSEVGLAEELSPASLSAALPVNPSVADAPASVATSASSAGEATGTVSSAHDAAAVGTSAGTDTWQLLQKGLARFRQQVTYDFCHALEDAKDAFRPKFCPAWSEGRVCKVDRVSIVPAAFIGAVVASRLAPVRLLRLTADSVAAAAGKHVPAELPAVEAAGQELPSAAPAERGSAGTSAGLAEEFRHFTEQVVQDFRSAKADAQVAFTYVVGGDGPVNQCPVAKEENMAQQPLPLQNQDNQEHQQQRMQEQGLQPEGQQLPQPWQRARSTIPEAAASMSGAIVASTLAPIRAVRLAVASVAVVASATVAGHTEAVESQATN